MIMMKMICWMSVGGLRGEQCEVMFGMRKEREREW